MRTAILALALLGPILRAEGESKDPACADATRPPRPDHVVLVILENHPYEQIVGVPEAPFIDSLAKAGANFTQAYAITHPSQPNYLHLFAGSDFGVADDNVPPKLPFTAPNLGAGLLARGFTFAGYSEGQPAAGFQGPRAGDYARKHNPWSNWQGARRHGLPPASNLPLDSLPPWDKLPTVAILVPDQAHDMHDGHDPDRIIAADAWLKAHVGGYLAWAKDHNSLLIVTFDEDDDRHGNRIPLILVGPMVNPNAYPERVDHHRVLRTLEDMYGLGHAGAAAKAKPILDVWRNGPGCGSPAGR